jgi:hypothetical protein
MLFSDNRQDIRRTFIEVWEKLEARTPLTQLEDLIAGVIQQHPEYHTTLAQGEAVLDRDWTPEHGETNPFLHMGMHIAIREQLSIDRPPGIRAAHEALGKKLGDAHAAEHQMQEALGETLWEAQRAGIPPDEQRYLQRVREMARK